ncbi:MAG: Holliday junction branch migration DNA helicase RuvB [Patescibacteria group bacterium]|nr:Holliday junction branch migration DNA helicase RuvB [Patescibacteria group bacterium]
MIESNHSQEDDQASPLDAAQSTGEDAGLDQNLRPVNLDEYVGQAAVKENLRIVMQAAKQRGETLEHLLFYGPPGLGKTTLALIIAREMGVNIKITSGPAIERAGDLASLLTNLNQGDVLFIDEIHRLNKVVEEVLYPAMEDYALDIVLGKGPGARSIRMDLPKFTLIGATTRIGLISSPLRDRFGATWRLEYYTPEELQQIIQRSAKILGAKIETQASLKLAQRSRLTPRIANRLVKRVRDFAQVNGHDTITETVVNDALKLLEVDELGLDKNDRRILEALVHKFSGSPVGLSTLAAATGEEEDTITDVHEPFLIRLGLITRTPKGRQATTAAYQHLGVTAPPSGSQQKSLL